MSAHFLPQYLNIDDPDRSENSRRLQFIMFLNCGWEAIFGCQRSFLLQQLLEINNTAKSILAAAPYHNEKAPRMAGRLEGHGRPDVQAQALRR
ncbi:hypothetical protein [Chelatococcus sp. CO-6]|uniref:hypothetical protein n=1 Tax=Chelatococcus sp. CO-6 TaxID=1702325 RepID=UPI0012E24A2B|nr:hypothetical protein [Chelatococcus sp. CO-6]